MLVIYLLLLLAFSFILIKATDLVIQALNRLSKVSKISQFALTSFLMALATSLPELFVGITAALEKQPNLALGNIIGSNIANLSLVIGGAAVVGGSIGVVGEFLSRDILYAFWAAGVPLIFLLDNQLSRVEGLLLLLIYGIYHSANSLGKKRGKPKMDGAFQKLLRRLNRRETDRQLVWVFVGATLLIFSADMIVRLAGLIAESLNIPLIFVGLFLVAVGTSLPELSFEIGAARRKEVGMVFGDLLGSIIANSTLILGITALISPIVLDKGLKVYLWAVVFFILIFFLFWLFVHTKKKLERWEGLILIMVYFLFVLFEVWRITL